MAIIGSLTEVINNSFILFFLIGVPLVDEDVDLILKSHNDCGANIYYYKNNTISFLINSHNECMITVFLFFYIAIK